MGVFDGAIEALHDAAAAWEPVNNADQASAQKMRLMMADVPEFLNAVGGVLQILADKSIERIMLDPGGAEALHSLAANIRSQIDPMRELADSMDRIHADRLEHMRSDDHRAGSWDWHGNQDEDINA